MQGTIAGVDEMNRNGKGGTISATDFKVFKDAAAAEIVTDATATGSTQWTTNWNVDDMTASISEAESDALKNVTSIGSFDPITAMGATTCSRIRDQTKCTRNAMASLCEWTAGSCTTRTTIDMCSWATAMYQCTRSGSWCKWTPSSAGTATAGTCETKTSDEVQAIENSRTDSPTMAPTWQPTQPSTFDMCKICIKNKLDWGVVRSQRCHEYTMQKCDVHTLDYQHGDDNDASAGVTSPATEEEDNDCKYDKVKDACPGVGLCASFCKPNYGYDVSGAMCCKAYTATCLACQDGIGQTEYCEKQAELSANEIVPGCESGGGTAPVEPTPSLTPTSSPTMANGATPAPTTEADRTCGQWQMQSNLWRSSICVTSGSSFLSDRTCGADCTATTCCMTDAQINSEPATCEAWRMTTNTVATDVCNQASSGLSGSGFSGSSNHHLTFHGEYLCGSSFSRQSTDYYNNKCEASTCCVDEMPTPKCKEHSYVCSATQGMMLDSTKEDVQCIGGCTTVSNAERGREVVANLFSFFLSLLSFSRSDSFLLLISFSFAGPLLQTDAERTVFTPNYSR